MAQENEFKAILYRIKHEKGMTMREIAEKLGVTYSYLSDVHTGRAPYNDVLRGKIIKKFGVHIANNEPTPQHVYGGGDDEQAMDVPTEKMITLPLIPLDAVAGFPLFDNAGITISDCEQYSVPEFSVRGAEFLVRVSGSSMTPRFANGDLLACKKVAQATFFQWGMVYVIDTQQGMLVKRLYECPNDDDMVICHSENTIEYPDFKLPKSEIRSVSIVIGYISVQ